MDKITRRQWIAGGAALATTATLAHAAPGAGTAAGALKGKTILITGASSGFGRLGALHYARLGATVVASMRAWTPS